MAAGLQEIPWNLMKEGRMAVISEIAPNVFRISISLNEWLAAAPNADVIAARLAPW